MDFEQFFEEAKRTDCDYAAVLNRFLKDPYKLLKLNHAATGMVTEAAEAADILKKHLYYGKPLDIVHLSEEVGDLMWYLHLIFSACPELSMAKILEANNAKLRARYPEKFSEESAINRDVDAERKILDQNLQE
jgi:NTP pyrophosphatase (non-canonical NTP hydrolase)